MNGETSSSRIAELGADGPWPREACAVPRLKAVWSGMEDYFGWKFIIIILYGARRVVVVKTCRP